MPSRPAAIATPHRAATAAGASVLADGGTALDAAVAANAMLGVAYPHMCGLGGDLFLLHHDGASGTVTCLNGSGAAPGLADAAAYRARGLGAVPVRGPLSATVPGTVAAWEEALARFGSRPLGELLAPAAAAAEEGVEVTARLAGWIARSASDLRADPLLARRFLDPAGAPLTAGATLRQPELAATLQRLAEAGARDFYAGELAMRIDRAFQDAGGLLRRADLERCAPEWVEPIRTAHRGLEVVTTPPNSQGVTALLMLDALTELGAEGLEPGTVAHVEALVRAKRAAFALRDAHVADPAFEGRAAAELLDRETLRAALRTAPVAPPQPVGGDTVYLCTLDRDGNACSLIQSVYYGFGACFTAGDTGVLMHNRAHAFSLDDGHPNRIAPGKRPRHTLMASLVLDGGRLRYVLGSMGADGQPQFNVQVLARLLAGCDPQRAVAAPRVLHGRFVIEDDPDVLHVEADLGDDAIAALGRAGHALDVVPPHTEAMGHAHAIAIAPGGGVAAGADPRSDGAAEVVA